MFRTRAQVSLCSFRAAGRGWLVLLQRLPGGSSGWRQCSGGLLLIASAHSGSIHGLADGEENRQDLLRLRLLPDEGAKTLFADCQASAG